jgi:hypothetical protein
MLIVVLWPILISQRFPVLSKYRDILSLPSGICLPPGVTGEGKQQRAAGSFHFYPPHCIRQYV